MKRRDASYGFKERYDDLNRAYRKALTYGNFNTQLAALAAAVDMPSKRFWVSVERLVEVINAMESGGEIRVGHNSPKREMYDELFRRYKAYKAEHPNLSKTEICSEIIYQPAPKFYMKPSWAKKILLKGRDKHRHHHHHHHNHENE